MYKAGDQFFARSRLAEDQNRPSVVRHPLNALYDRTHAGRIADKKARRLETGRNCQDGLP
jgi:hypothetical protein